MTVGAIFQNCAFLLVRYVWRDSGSQLRRQPHEGSSASPDILARQDNVWEAQGGCQTLEGSKSREVAFLSLLPLMTRPWCLSVWQLFLKPPVAGTFRDDAAGAGGGTWPH